VSKISEAPLLSVGMTYEQMAVGLRFRTAARIITETDLISFLTLAGFSDSLFWDVRHARSAGYMGRLVPAALTYSIAEGLVLQTHALTGTGLAFVHMELDVIRPVYVGDTLETVVEISESRASKKPGRGVVTSRNHVLNQHGEEVLVYTAVRIIRGRASADVEARSTSTP
jgi:acyl dehydratase